jgi:DNA-binding NarL/FixJ family response regulator
MAPLPQTRNPHCARTRLILFCRHPFAQERFSRLLRRTGFTLLTRSQFHPSAFDKSDPALEWLAVVDGSDLNDAVVLIRSLRAQQNSLHVLVLLPTLEDSIAYSLLRLGVRGLVSYALASRELARASQQVADGGYWVPREVLTGFVESVLPELQGCKSLDSEIAISRREHEVLDLLLDNLANKEIAAKLFVSERTIKFHVSNLLSKFGVQRRADLIVLWMQRNRGFPWQTPALSQPLSAHVN